MVNTRTSPPSQATNIGILFVHGIGEQRQFQALQGLADSFMKALANQQIKKLKINLQINKLSSGPLGAEQQTWDDSSQAPIIIHIKDVLGQDIYIHLREVWWADIDPPNNLGKVLRFWQWGLSLWSTRGFLKGPIPGNYKKELRLLEPPNHKKSEIRKIYFWMRSLYFVIGIIFFLVQPILSFFNVFFNIFGIPFVSVTAITQFASKIRLYQLYQLYQKKSDKYKGTLQDLDNPPRFTVRRRMINAMIPMATSEYDRWYIMAHSLGAVVTFNSLNELELNLANYLDEKMWNRACRFGLNQPDTPREDPSVKDNMRPSRPFWLGKNDRIYRHKLFKNLQGLVTYGAPLGIFVNLWPMIMLGNQDKEAFNSSFRWFNIDDPSDPVSTKAQPFFPSDYTGIKPIDITYKADWLHLVSHVSYLKTDPKSNDALIDRILDWVMYEKLPNTPRQHTPSKKWLKKSFHVNSYRSLSYLLWFVGSYVATWILTGILGLLNMVVNFNLFNIFPQSLNRCSNSWIIGESLCNILLFYPLCWIMLAFIFVLFIGILQGISQIFAFDLKERILSFLEDQANQRFTVSEIQDKFGESIKVNQKALDELTKENQIRKDSDNKYFYPSYSFIQLDEFKDKITAYDVGGRLQLIDEIIDKLSFNPDTEGEDRRKKGSIWSLTTSSNFLVWYGVSDSSTPLQDSIIALHSIRLRYRFIQSDEFRKKIIAYDVDRRSQLIDEIIEKLSFNPDTEGEDRFRESWIDPDGQEYSFWLLEISSDLIVSYTVIDSSTPLQDPIIVIIDLI